MCTIVHAFVCVNSIFFICFVVTHFQQKKQTKIYKPTNKPTNTFSRVASPTKHTLELIRMWSFEGAKCIILSDHNAYASKYGRNSFLLNSNTKSLFVAIEGKVVNGGILPLEGDDFHKDEFEPCQKACIEKEECQAFDYPDCTLRQSNIVDTVDDTYSKTTYVKITENTGGNSIYTFFFLKAENMKYTHIILCFRAF